MTAVPPEFAHHLTAAIDGSREILLAHHLDHVVSLLEKRLRLDEQERCVVVVGEVGRGKSAMVNALVGQLDVVPVAAAATTMIPVSISIGTPPATYVLGAETRRVTPQEYVTAVTSPDGDVTAAACRITDSALGDVTIIDTPGASGLSADASRLATVTASQACLVLLVCDAGSPLTAPEMALARQVIQHAGGVIVAVAKTDQYLLGWQAVAAENRRLLRAHLGVDVPVIGVSSERVLQTLDRAEPIRTHHENAAGITELRAEVRTYLHQASLQPQAAILRFLLQGLDQARRQIVADCDRLAGPPDDAAAAAKEMLEVLAADQRQWEHLLGRDLAVVRSTTTDRVSRRLEALRADWSARIAKQGIQTLRRKPAEITAEIQRDLEQIIVECLTALVEDLRREVVGPRFGNDDSTVWDALWATICDEVAGRELDAHPVPSRSQGVVDPSLLTIGVVGSSVIGGLIGASSLIGVGAIIGTVWVGVNLGFRAIRTGKQAMHAWLRDTLATTAAAVNRIADLIVTHARAQVAIAYRERLRVQIEHQKRLHTALAEADRAATERRRRTVAALTANLDVVDDHIAQVTELLSTLTER